MVENVGLFMFLHCANELDGSQIVFFHAYPGKTFSYVLQKHFLDDGFLSCLNSVFYFADFSHLETLIEHNIMGPKILKPVRVN